jgi:type VI secretion system FHA domain protein
VPEAGADEFDWLGKLQPKPVEGDLFTLDVRPTQAQAAPPDSDIFFRPEREASSLLIPGIENPGGLAPPSLDPLKLLDGQGANTHDAQFGALLETGSGGERPLLVEFGGRDRERESASLSPVHVQAIHAKFTPPTVVPTAALEDAGEPIDWPPDWPFDTPPGGASAEKQAGDPPVPPAPPAVASPDADAIHSFLRGLGMSFQVPTGQEAEFFEKAGEIMKVAVQGLVNLLLARAEVKRELRAEDRTMLAASANNPLKFVGGSEEALRFLFDPSTVQAGGFLPPVEAIEAACEELVAHELGMVAGTRAAVIGAIRRFDPDSFGHGAGHGVFALWRKARRWELYCAHYATLQAEMADNLDGLFQRDFLAAYTEQVRRVARHNLPSEQ